MLAREARGGEGYFGSQAARAEPALRAVRDAHLADGIARGELRADLDPQLARDFVFGGLEHWVRNTVGRGRPGDAAQAAREIVRMLLDGWACADAAPRRRDAWRGLEPRIARLERRAEARPLAAPETTETTK